MGKKDEQGLSAEEMATRFPMADDLDDMDLDSLDDGSSIGDDEEEPEEEEVVEEESDEEESEEEESDEEESEEEESDEEESDDDEEPKKDEKDSEEEKAEGEEEEAADDKKAESKKDDDDDDGPRIPKGRFDAINARLKEERRRNQELQAKISESEEGSTEHDQLTQIQSKLADLDEELTQAMLDGDADKIKKLRSEERQLTHTANNIEMTRQVEQTRIQARYDAVVDKVEEDYPEMNPNSDDYNEELVREVNRYRQKFMIAGDDPESALMEAISIVHPRYYEEAAPEKESLRKEPKKPSRDVSTPKKRNKKAAKAQPKDTSSRRSSETASDELPDVMKMTEEQFSRLTEKQQAQLRGDFVD